MNQERFQLDTILMQSTFKIEGRDSAGTAFFLGKSYDKRSDVLYPTLITASHVFEKMKGEKATLNLRKKENGLYKKIPCKISIREENKDLWTKHPEVDVAAMHIVLPEDFSIPLLSIGDLLAEDEDFERFEIHPGDELSCLGYPHHTEANEAGFPILRSGKIASFPLIPSRDIKHFLFDFEIFPGNSGGPVYFVESGRTYGGALRAETIQFIMGLVSQEYTVEETVKSIHEVKVKKHRLALAVVVHASFIKETIESLTFPD